MLLICNYYNEKYCVIIGSNKISGLGAPRLLMRISDLSF